MKTTIFLCQLSSQTQKEIREDIQDYLISKGYQEEEILLIVEVAMSGRLCDLEDDLCITPYIEVEERRIQFANLIVKHLESYCKRWSYDWMDHLKKDCTEKNFQELFCRVTRTYFIRNGNNKYYNVEFTKDNRVLIKECGPKFADREYDFVLDLRTVLQEIDKINKN